MAKVLLIQPNRDLKGNLRKESNILPSSLLWVATAIEDKHDVKIYDRNIKVADEDFLNFLKVLPKVFKLMVSIFYSGYSNLLMISSKSSKTFFIVFSILI